jgi:hypothetical protein
MKWLHRLFHPHCADCYTEAQENKVCESCETLKSELAAVRFQNEQLMKSILEIVHPAPQPISEIKEAEFRPLTTSWRVKKQMLEENDRLAARAMKEKQNEIYESSKSTQKLEEELLGA